MILSIILCLNILILISTFLIPATSNLLKIWRNLLIINFTLFFLSAVIWLTFSISVSAHPLQFQQMFYLTFSENYLIYFGIDGISLSYIQLTTFLTPICIFIGLISIKKNLKYYIICFLFLELSLILVFSVLDLLTFYILFETVLVPMFLLIGFWGSNVRKMKAAFYLFLYTFAGSLLMLLSILIIIFECGTTDLHVILTHQFPLIYQLIIWPGIFIAFAIKVPMFPFHIWLPEAHVEASTGGSIFLAGILLKLGSYGFLRYLIPLFPDGTYFYRPLVITLATVGIIYSAFAAICQVDLKKIIAYSSITHMNIAILGFFSFTLEGIQGAFLMSLGHGFISSALFFLVGNLYDRYKSRNIYDYNGLTMKMPLFSTFLFLFSLANVSFPLTVNFVSEFLILLGLTRNDKGILILIVPSLFVSTIYTFWLYNRIAFGTIPDKQNIGNIEIVRSNLYDLTRSEFLCLISLFSPTVFLGIFPNTVLQTSYYSLLFIISRLL